MNMGLGWMHDHYHHHLHTSHHSFYIEHSSAYNGHEDVEDDARRRLPFQEEEEEEEVVEDELQKGGEDLQEEEGVKMESLNLGERLESEDGEKSIDEFSSKMKSRGLDRKRAKGIRGRQQQQQQQRNHQIQRELKVKKELHRRDWKPRDHAMVGENGKHEHPLKKYETNDWEHFKIIFSDKPLGAEDDYDDDYERVIEIHTVV